VDKEDSIYRETFQLTWGKNMGF